MSKRELSQLECELHESIGAVDILDILREEMSVWLEEAQDASKREALENVLGHIDSMDKEYRSPQRRDSSPIECEHLT